MLCSPRGMHPMDCRIACDLSAVRYHGIYRKLSGDMIGACASAMMVSDCPHGQDKRIIQRKVSPKMPPHGAFQPNPHRRSTCQQKPFSGGTDGSIIAAKPKVADAGAGAPRCPGRSASPLPCAGVHAAGRGTAGNQAPLLQTRPDSSDGGRSELS